MLILVVFAFAAGFVTILSPCVLPVLPILLSGSVGPGRARPLGIVAGFIASFTFFTLALSALVRLTGLSADALRLFSILMLALLGLFLVVPALQLGFEVFTAKLLPNRRGASVGSGFFPGLLTGFSLGLIWTPCVGPIMAAVIALAASSAVTLTAVFITGAYSLGTAVPMLLVMFGGRGLLHKTPWLKTHTVIIQKIFGIVMIVLAFSIYQGYDRTFQTWVLSRFPEYGAGLTAIEKNEHVDKALDSVVSRPAAAEPVKEEALTQGPEAPEIIPGGQWFNTAPLKMQDLRGKVVLIDFWTYTCINCIRTLPYLNAWHERYSGKGLVIIGVHTPEFEFEKNPANVAKALASLGVKYPVVQDNDYATWNAYSNRYWPAKYFIDKEGRVRGSHFGEGDYDESEAMIRQLLEETGSSLGTYEKLPGYALEAQSPETYLGLNRTAGFASPEPLLPGTSHYTFPQTLPLNHYAYQGSWTAAQEFSAPGLKAEISFHFAAKDVFLVMRSPGGVSPVEVYLDGQPVLPALQGKDVQKGIALVSEDRLYHLVSLKAVSDHTLTLKFPQGGALLFAFTFG